MILLIAKRDEEMFHCGKGALPLRSVATVHPADGSSKKPIKSIIRSERQEANHNGSVELSRSALNVSERVRPSTDQSEMDNIKHHIYMM